MWAVWKKTFITWHLKHGQKCRQSCIIPLFFFPMCYCLFDPLLQEDYFKRLGRYRCAMYVWLLVLIYINNKYSSNFVEQKEGVIFSFYNCPFSTQELRSCPGQSLTPMSWLEFLNLSGIINCVTKSLSHLIGPNVFVFVFRSIVRKVKCLYNSSAVLWRRWNQNVTHLVTENVTNWAVLDNGRTSKNWWSARCSLVL